VLAHQFALASPMVQAEMVEATQFPKLSYQYQVSSVPHTSVNEGKGTVIGAMPEQYLVAELRKIFNGS